MKKFGILAVLMSLGLFTFVGCAGTEGDAANGNGDATEAADESTDAAAETTEEPAAEGDAATE